MSYLINALSQEMKSAERQNNLFIFADNPVDSSFFRLQKRLLLKSEK